MNWFSSSARNSAVRAGLTAGVAFVAAIGTSAQSKVQQKIITANAPPTLQVREFSGDFTQWGTKAALADGGLIKEFRWRTMRTDAAGARYEIAYGLTEPVKGPLTIPANRGAFGHFSIGFQPYLNKLAGSPSATKFFAVRVVLLDSRGNVLPPASPTVFLTYFPPSGGTRLDSGMALFLKAVKCIEVTSGPGSDEVLTRVIGWKSRGGGVAANLFHELHEGFDEGDAFLPDALLHVFTGLGFSPDVTIFAGLAEDDDPINFGTLDRRGKGVENGGDPVAQFKSVLCDDEDDCIGNPQKLAITAADWNKAVVRNQIVTKTLTFQGDGGHYQLVFELKKAF